MVCPLLGSKLDNKNIIAKDSIDNSIRFHPEQIVPKTGINGAELGNHSYAEECERSVPEYNLDARFFTIDQFEDYKIDK